MNEDQAKSLAAHVRGAVDSLNEAISEAQECGMLVDIDVYRYDVSRTMDAGKKTLVHVEVNRISLDL